MLKIANNIYELAPLFQFSKLEEIDISNNNIPPEDGKTLLKSIVARFGPAAEADVKF